MVATDILTTGSLGILILAITAFSVFSVVWVLNGGEMAAYKPASWISRGIFWYGVFIMGSLMLSVGLVVAMTLGRLAWGL